MNKKTVVKIKDSVDIFLSNEHYLMVYYMNSRQRKSFRANEEMVHLLETIDGEKTVEEIASIMSEKWSVDSECTNQIMDKLQENRIITEVVSQQNILSEKLIKRYTRQINYFSEFLGSELEGIAAQRKLMDSNIIIFGCGAVGGNIAMQLVMAGVGHIILFDYDRNEPSDVSRHMYFRKQYIGMNKVDSLKAELMRINSYTDVRCIVEWMKPETDVVELIRSADFVVNTLDEPYIGYTASKISRICVKYKIPHYIAGGFDAHLASTGELIIPYVTPCVECYTTHFREVLKDWKPKKHPVERRYTEIGGVASMSLFSSSYACIEIIKYIAGLVQMEDSYKIRGEFLFHDMSLTYLNVKKNPECPICGRGEKDES